MADVTIIHPSAQVPTVSSGGQQPQSSTEAGGTHPNLPQGTLVSGTIVGRDPNGNFLLKSPQGTFNIASSTPLTYNSDVTIRIGANTPGSTNARIVSVNGEPFADFATPDAEVSDSVSSNLLTQVTKAVAQVSQVAASLVRGVVTSAPPSVEQQGGTNLTAGNTVILRIPQPLNATGLEQTQTEVTDTSNLSTSAVSSANQAVQPEQVAQNAQPAIFQQPATAPQPQPQTQNAAPVGTPVAVSATAPVETELAPAQTVTQATQGEATNSQPQPPPQQTTAQAAQQPARPVISALYSAYTKQAPTANAAPAPLNANAPATLSQTLPAQVIAQDENGNISLQTPIGNVTVNTPVVPQLTALAPGAALTLEVIANSLPQTSFSTTPAPLNELAASWQSLKDIATVETAQSNSSASPALLSHLPQLGQNFVSESLAFIAALMQGQPRKLLGNDTVENLKQSGHEELIEKFSSEASNLSESLNTPQTPRQAPSWQTLFLPFVFQEALQQARIYVKREAPKKDKASKAPVDTRFIVEVDMSETGPLQMDGLVRKQQKGLGFDLVIRSHNAFSEEDQSEIFTIYNSAAELTGFKGTLVFQVTRDFPVKPLEDLAQDAAPGITV